MANRESQSAKRQKYIKSSSLRLAIRATRPAPPGFTLIELLVVIALIGILAAALLYALNPDTQFARARNSRRQQDVDQISKGALAYSISEDEIPTTIPLSTSCDNPAHEICRTDAASCAGIVDLGALTLNERYLTEFPKDPKSSTDNGTGYHIVKNANNRIMVCAPHAEKGVSITVTR